MKVIPQTNPYYNENSRECYVPLGKNPIYFCVLLKKFVSKSLVLKNY